jgi:hypothetical protein
MEEVIVRTKEELEKAVSNKVKTIIIKGELAEKVNLSLKVKKSTLILLAGATASITLTSGLSLPLTAAFTAPALTGEGIALIIAIIFLGIALVLALAKDYKKVSFKVKTGNNEAELVLERVR